MKKKLGDIGRLLQPERLRHAIRSVQDGDLDAYSFLREGGLDKLSPVQRRLAAASFYKRAKQSMGRQDWPLARSLMRAAASLEPQNRLRAHRLSLLELATGRYDALERKMRGQETQRTLHSICTKTPCVCLSSIEVAICRNILEDNFPAKGTLSGVQVHTMGPYHTRPHRGRWTKLLSDIKGQHEPAGLKPLADIVADYLAEKTDVLEHVDVLVPVPPDPRKRIERGFAPNEILAHHLTTRLGLPLYPVLIRTEGPTTREASAEELAAEFYVDDSGGHSVTDASVLLVEDIWTRGRTIPICASKLTAAGAREVIAIALAKATQ